MPSSSKSISSIRLLVTAVTQSLASPTLTPHTKSCIVPKMPMNTSQASLSIFGKHALSDRR